MLVSPEVLANLHSHLPADADPQETAEWLAKKFGPQLGQTSTQALTQRVAAFAGKYGDDGLGALRGTSRLTRAAPAPSAGAALPRPGYRQTSTGTVTSWLIAWTRT